MSQQISISNKCWSFKLYIRQIIQSKMHHRSHRIYEAAQLFSTSIKMFLEHQSIILQLFLKDRVTLKTLQLWCEPWQKYQLCPLTTWWQDRQQNIVTSTQKPTSALQQSTSLIGKQQIGVVSVWPLDLGLESERMSCIQSHIHVSARWRPRHGWVMGSQREHEHLFWVTCCWERGVFRIGATSNTSQRGTGLITSGSCAPQITTSCHKYSNKT